MLKTPTTPSSLLSTSSSNRQLYRCNESIGPRSSRGLPVEKVYLPDYPCLSQPRWNDALQAERIKRGFSQGNRSGCQYQTRRQAKISDAMGESTCLTNHLILHTTTIEFRRIHNHLARPTRVRQQTSPGLPMPAVRIVI